MTMSAGATTAAVRLIMSGKAWPIMPPPAATSTRKNVPSTSENSRRHSWRGSLKSVMRVNDFLLVAGQGAQGARRGWFLFSGHIGITLSGTGVASIAVWSGAMCSGSSPTRDG